jgi:porphobilinogen deaminase
MAPESAHLDTPRDALVDAAPEDLAPRPSSSQAGLASLRAGAQLAGLLGGVR